MRSDLSPQAGRDDQLPTPALILLWPGQIWTRIMSVEVVTFGCRLNAFESEVVRVEAERAGLADTVVINSCAVTNEAVAQARQSIRRLKRERPDVRIVVTGCAAQTQPKMFAEMAEVDRVVGNDDKMRGDAWRDARAAFDGGFGV